MDHLRLNPGKVAVVIVDVQNDFGHPSGEQGQAGKDISTVDDAVTATDRLIAAARRAGVPVVFVLTTHSEATDTPEWLARRSQPNQPQNCLDGSWGAEMYQLAPQPDDLIITKHRYGAFTRTTLEDQLHAIGRSSLLFCGITTAGCVETSLREAVCRDFLATLVEDCCAAYSVEAHERAKASVRAGFGLVVDSESICAYWESLR